jgi:sigma-54-specific transcriptional regulator
VHDIVQKALVTAAFEHAHRNQLRAAIRLGITRNILRTQLKQFGLLGPHQEPVQ